jgi:Tetratricopeptide repeat
MVGAIRIALLVCLLFITQMACGVSWSDLWLRKDQQGMRLLQKGKNELAAKRFESLPWKGVADYRSKNYSEVEKDLKNEHDPISKYNLGNALAFQGKYQEAINAYDGAIKQRPDFKDAIYNRDLVKKLLEHQKHQQQQNNNTKENHQNQQSKQKQQNNQNDSNQDQKNPQKEQGDNKNKNEGDKNKDQQNTPPDRENNTNQKDSAKDRQEQNKQNQQKDNHEEPHEQVDNGKEQKNKGDLPSKNRQADRNEPSQQKNDPQAQNGDDQGVKQEQNSLANADVNQNNKGAHGKQEELAKKLDQETNQWLQQIEDDPSDLLRRKILRDHLNKINQTE